MSATRSFRKDARSPSLAFTGDFFRLFGSDTQCLRGDLDVLVTAAREVHDEVLPWPELSSDFFGVEDRVRRLERGDDAFELRTQGESSQRLFVGDAGVLGEPFVLEVSVLRARRRVVEAGGDRVRLPDLATFGLQHVAQGAVQYAE